MTEPYLIAHIVRGEPAFDIAIELPIGDEEGWIIPTSGHRAYPYHTWRMEDLFDGSDMDMPKPMDVLEREPPPNHPDHYPVLSAPRARAVLADLSSFLGLSKPPTITRR